MRVGPQISLCSTRKAANDGWWEGIATVIVASIAFFALFDFPETATFLTEEERAFVIYRLKYQGQNHNPNGTQVAQADEFRWQYVKDAFLDWQIWVNIFVYWGVSGPQRTPNAPPFSTPQKS